MNKKLIVLIILICILSVGIVYMYRTKIMGTGALSTPETQQAAAVQPETEAQIQPQTQMQTQPVNAGVVYTYYAGTYLSLDEDWTVCANTSQKPAEIPEITGVGFERMVYGKTAEPENDFELDYAIRVALNLKKHDIHASRIDYHDRMITVNVDNLKIELGKDDKTEDKINDLNDFIDMVSGLHGTLYMQNGDANDYGYTFREDEA